MGSKNDTPLPTFWTWLISRVKPFQAGKSWSPAMLVSAPALAAQWAKMNGLTFAWNWHQLKHTLWYTLDTNNGGTSGTSTWRRIPYVSMWIYSCSMSRSILLYVLSRILNMIKGCMLYPLGFPKVLYRLFPHVFLQNTSISSNFDYADVSTQVSFHCRTVSQAEPFTLAAPVTMQGGLRQKKSSVWKENLDPKTKNVYQFILPWFTI